MPKQAHFVTVRSLYLRNGRALEHFTLDHDPLNDRGPGLFDQLNKLLSGLFADRRGILSERSEPRDNVPSDPDSVVSRDGDILSDHKPALADHIASAEGREIVGVEDACRRRLKIKKLLCHARRALCAAVRRLEHVFVGDIEPQLLRRPVEGRETAARNRRVKAVDIRDPAVPAFVNIGQEIAHSADIVGYDRSPVIEYMVNRNERDRAVHKLRNVG